MLLQCLGKQVQKSSYYVTELVKWDIVQKLKLRHVFGMSHTENIKHTCKFPEKGFGIPKHAAKDELPVHFHPWNTINRDGCSSRLSTRPSFEKS